MQFKSKNKKNTFKITIIIINLKRIPEKALAGYNNIFLIR